MPAFPIPAGSIGVSFVGNPPRINEIKFNSPLRNQMKVGYIIEKLELGNGGNIIPTTSKSLQLGFQISSHDQNRWLHVKVGNAYESYVSKTSSSRMISNRRIKNASSARVKDLGDSQKKGSTGSVGGPDMVQQASGGSDMTATSTGESGVSSESIDVPEEQDENDDKVIKTIEIFLSDNPMKEKDVGVFIRKKVDHKPPKEYARVFKEVDIKEKRFKYYVRYIPLEKGWDVKAPWFGDGTDAGDMGMEQTNERELNEYTRMIFQVMALTAKWIQKFNYQGRADSDENAENFRGHKYQNLIKAGQKLGHTHNDFNANPSVETFRTHQEKFIAYLTLIQASEKEILDDARDALKQVDWREKFPKFKLFGTD